MLRENMVLEVRDRMGKYAPKQWNRILRTLDEGITHFCHEERWSWLQASRTDTLLLNGQTIVLPDDLDITQAFNFVLEKSPDKPYMPKRVTPAEGIMAGVSRTTASQPRWYYLESTAQSVGQALQYTVKFVPKADGTYTITMHYLRKPASLLTATEPSIPEDYQRGIIAYATAQLWLSSDNPQAATRAADQIELYNAVVRQARQDQRRFGADEPVIFGGHAEEGREDPWLPGLPSQFGPSYPWSEF